MTDEELRPLYEETIILSLANQKKWEKQLERADELMNKFAKLLDYELERIEYEQQESNS